MHKFLYWIGLSICIAAVSVANAQVTPLQQVYNDTNFLVKSLPPQDWQGPFTEGNTSVFKKFFPVEEGVVFIATISIQADLPSDLIQTVNTLQYTPTDTIITPLWQNTDIPDEIFFGHLIPLFTNSSSGEIELQLIIDDPATELSIGEIIDSEYYVFGIPDPNDPGTSITADQWRKQSSNAFTANVDLANNHKKSIYVWESILVHKDSQLGFCANEVCKIRSNEDHELVFFFTISDKGYAGNIELTSRTTATDDPDALISNLVVIDTFEDDEDARFVILAKNDWEYDQTELTYQSVIADSFTPAMPWVAMIAGEQAPMGEYYWHWSENISPNSKIGIAIGDHAETLFPTPGAEFRFTVGPVTELIELYRTNTIQITDYSGSTHDIDEIITYGEIYLDLALQ